MTQQGAQSAVHRSALSGFSAQAAAYAAGRPDYPPELVTWLSETLSLHEGKVALDLGAGTGKCLPYLIATGARILAVEPVAAMRAELTARFPTIPTLEGTATQIPIEDRTIDAVVCAQSFHWFAISEALAEVRRVLKCGGMLGLIWNHRDTRVPWVEAISAVTAPYRGDTPDYKSGAWRHAFPAAGFGPLSERAYAHSHRGDPETVIIDRIRSVSYIAALPRDEQDHVIAKLRAMIAGTPELVGRDDVTFPYRTMAYWCVRS